MGLNVSLGFSADAGQGLSTSARRLAIKGCTLQSLKRVVLKRLRKAQRPLQMVRARLDILLRIVRVRQTLQRRGPIRHDRRDPTARFVVRARRLYDFVAELLARNEAVAADRFEFPQVGRLAQFIHAHQMRRVIVMVLDNECISVGWWIRHRRQPTLWVISETHRECFPIDVDVARNRAALVIVAPTSNDPRRTHNPGQC